MYERGDVMKGKNRMIYQGYRANGSNNPLSGFVKLKFINVPSVSLQCSSLSRSSSSAPTVPFSTADVLYGNDLNKSPKVEDEQSIISYASKDKIETISDLDEQTYRRPSSKGGLLNSRSIEKASYKKEFDDTLRPNQFLPSPAKNGLQFRQNGLRCGSVKGDQLFTSSRPNGLSSGRNSDDLIAMGTIWSPNSQSHSKLNIASSNSLSITNTSLSVVPSKSIVMSSTSSSSSTGLVQHSQQRSRCTNTVRPIMVNARSSSKPEVEPKYTDPVIGAPASFQQRLMELSALEAETIRYERNKKVKKKVKQDRDS